MRSLWRSCPHTSSTAEAQITAPGVFAAATHERMQLGRCQNYGPFLGTLNIRCRIIIGTQKGTIILTTTQLNSNSYRPSFQKPRHLCKNHRTMTEQNSRTPKFLSPKAQGTMCHMFRTLRASCAGARGRRSLPHKNLRPSLMRSLNRPTNTTTILGSQ